MRHGRSILGRKIEFNEYLKLCVWHLILIELAFILPSLFLLPSISSNLVATLTGLAIVMWFLPMALVFVDVFLYPAHVNKEKVEEEEFEEMEEPAVYDGEPRDITSGINTPYLNPLAVPEPIIVANKEANLYQQKDLVFDFLKRPHTLLIGESGSGKTVTLFNLVRIMQNQYPNSKFVIVDYGQQDMTQSYPADIQTFMTITEQMFYIMKGRQKEGKKDWTRIIWLVEEFESVLGEVKLLPKDEQNKFVTRLASIGRMARKLGMNMLFVTQSAKASDFDTAIRNNFGNRFIMRQPNKHLTSGFGCKYDVNNLPTGIGWASTIDDFVQFELTTEPKMEMISPHELQRLAANYKRQYKLEEEYV